MSDATLIGSAPEITKHFIELRGIGIVDVKMIFGIGAVKNVEKIDFVINLELWQDKKLYDRLAIAMARQVAIVPGQLLTGEEIQALVSNLFNCKMNARTPDGKSIIYVETDTEIARFFSK